MEKRDLSIMVVEDNEGDFVILKDHLFEIFPKASVDRKISLLQAKQSFIEETYDIVLLDLTLPDSVGVNSITELLKVAPTVPIIVFTGYEDKELAVNSLKLGVQDYLVKDEVIPAILLKSISYAIERKIILNQVKSAKENYKSLFDKNPIPLFLYDPVTLQILVVNQACTELYLYSADQLLQMTVEDLMTSGEKSRISTIRDAITVSKSGSVPLGEWRQFKSDGTEIEVDITTHDFMLGLRTCRLAVLKNVTEINTARLNLQRSEKRFRSLVQSGADLIGILDKDGNYLYKSPTITTVLGYTTEFLIGRNTFDLIHEEEIAQVLADFDKLKTQSQVSFKPFRVLDSWGNWRWIESIVTNLLDEPSVMGIVTNSRDLTEKKKQEDEKTLLIKELTQNNTDLKQFSFITSHNLRAPITNLLSILELFSYAGIKEEKAQFFFDMFKKSTLQLDETINDLVKILVIKSNANIGLEEISLTSIFSKITGMLSAMISDVKAEINVDFNEAPQLVSNATYLESIFMNLLTNAIKYRDTERELVINTYTQKGDGCTMLYFQDNGLGIDLVRNKDKIFGLHQRFHEVGEGNGIGLYLIQSQIKALNGTISVDSKVGSGTTFIITFNN